MQAALVRRLTLSFLCICLPAAAQDLPSTEVRHPAQQLTSADLSSLAPEAARRDLALQPTVSSPFASLKHDLTTGLFSVETARLIGVFGGLSALAHGWDARSAEEARELPAGAFRAGNIGGGFPVQLGLGLATYSIGRVAGNQRVIHVGADLFRAQAVSQLYVQATKLATRRQRPDGSNRHSFPSGHTASAFATAAVLERHFGWKVGVPAYAFGAYVAASRMSANKHHLSDVLMGAGLGIASGYSVTVGMGGQRFALGVSPTVGGAAVTFTKK